MIGLKLLFLLLTELTSFFSARGFNQTTVFIPLTITVCGGVRCVTGVERDRKYSFWCDYYRQRVRWGGRWEILRNTDWTAQVVPVNVLRTANEGNTHRNVRTYNISKLVGGREMIQGQSNDMLLLLVCTDSAAAQHRSTHTTGWLCDELSARIIWQLKQSKQ